MRQGSNSGRRPRGRTNRKQHGGGGGGGQSRTHTFDSAGPDGRVRGNARQVYEKYLSLARDASSAGDRIAAEAYYQHAEHYFRILSDSTDPTPSGRRPEERQPQPYGHAHDDAYYGDDDEEPVNGQGQAQGHGQGHRQGGERHGQEARGNGAGQPQPHRDGGYRDQQPREQHSREQQPREQHSREQQPREQQPRDRQPREAAPRDAAVPAGDGAQTPGQTPSHAQGHPQGQSGAEEGEAPQRPRRGRPRKPRQEDEGQAHQQDASSEPESGPVVG